MFNAFGFSFFLDRQTEMQTTKGTLKKANNGMNGKQQKTIGHNKQRKIRTRNECFDNPSAASSICIFTR